LSLINVHYAFNYNQYEIGPYAMGAPSFFFKKWSELKGVLKENPYVEIQ
jgi:hypothetical protein